MPLVEPLASTRMSPVVMIERLGNESFGADPRIDAAASSLTLPARMASVPEVNDRLAPGLRSSARPPRSSVVLGFTVRSPVTTQGLALAGQRSVADETAAVAGRGTSPSGKATATNHPTATRMRKTSKSAIP